MPVYGIIMFSVIGVFIFVCFVFTFVLIFSPKVRGKFMSMQVKSAKYMVDESKEDIESINTTMARASEDAVEITTRAVKKGLTQDEKVFCKHCGAKIDSDSKFCSKCGKEL